jgi:hypothetical protein
LQYENEQICHQTPEAINIYVENKLLFSPAKASNAG